MLKKALLVISIVFIIIGGAVFALSMNELGWDFIKLSSTDSSVKEHVITNEFDTISIISDSSDVKFIFSESVENRVVCHERENMSNTVSVENGVLAVNTVDSRSWTDYFLLFENNKITVYLNKTDFKNLLITSDTGDTEIPSNFKFENVSVTSKTGDVSIKSTISNSLTVNVSTGDVKLEGATASSIKISGSTASMNLVNTVCEGNIQLFVSTGDVKLEGVRCLNLETTGNTSTLYLTDVIASENFFIERSTGDIIIKSSDANEIFIETDTGDIEATLLTDKIFIPKSSTGDIDVPETVSGGKCKITTGTGDISVKIK